MVPEGIDAGVYFRIDVSPDGRKGILQDNNHNTFSLVDLDRQEKINLLGNGISGKLPYVECSGWVDGEHVLISSTAEDPASLWRRWLVESTYDKGGVSVVFQDSATSPYYSNTVSYDGKWVSRILYTSSTKTRIEIAPIDAKAIGAPVVTNDYDRDVSSFAAFWAPKHSKVTLWDKGANGQSNYTSYDLSNTKPLVLSHSTFEEWGTPAYSPSSNHTYWSDYLFRSGQFAIINLSTGGLRTLAVPKSSQGYGISPQNDYAIITDGGKISSIPLQRPDGSDIETLTPNVLMEHVGKMDIKQLEFLRDGREIVYGILDRVSNRYDHYWFSVSNPTGTLRNLSNSVGSDVSGPFYLAPSQDYIAFPSKDGSNVILLRLDDTLATQKLVVTTTNDGSLTETVVAWAPDNSGFIAVNVGRTSTAYFFPRNRNGSPGFGPPSTISMGFSKPENAFGLNLLLPKRWE
jgi:hypothetical protein